MRPGRADPGVRQGPGRLLVPLHLLRHPAGARAGAIAHPEAVLEDVRAALARGRREIVLTGINIGTYDGGASEPGPRGSHAWEALSLAGLIRRILDETPVERLRLSSIEAQHVSDELLEVWARSGGRCLPHFHVPLQAGDDGVLRRMGRRYDTAAYAGMIRRIRQTVPGAAIHADVIAGFPTEDDAAWERGRAFIESVGFAGLHVFRYSARPGTPAVRMAGQVDEPVRRERAAALLDAGRAAPPLLRGAPGRPGPGRAVRGARRRGPLGGPRGEPRPRRGGGAGRPGPRRT